jgi:hypothetical protein
MRERIKNTPARQYGTLHSLPGWRPHMMTQDESKGHTMTAAAIMDFRDTSPVRVTRRELGALIALVLAMALPQMQPGPTRECPAPDRAQECRAFTIGVSAFGGPDAIGGCVAPAPPSLP